MYTPSMISSIRRGSFIVWSSRDLLGRALGHFIFALIGLERLLPTNSY